MCAHIGQNWDIYPQSIFRLHFDSYTPPPFPQVDGGGAAIEKNFFDFYFSDFSPYSQNVWIENIFLFSRFSHSISTRILFFYFFLIFVWILVSTLFFRLSYLIISTRLKFVILYSILFFRLSIVSTRYKLSLDILLV